MFAYCRNNPANYSDPSGCRPSWEYNFGNGVVGYTDAGTGSYSIPEDGNYITNQQGFSAALWALGTSTVGACGCGIIAAYNILLALGVDITFSQVYFAALELLTITDSGITLNDVITLVHFFDPSVIFQNGEDPNSSSDLILILYGYYKDSGERDGGHIFVGIRAKAPHNLWLVPNGIDSFNQMVAIDYYFNHITGLSFVNGISGYIEEIIFIYY